MNCRRLIGAIALLAALPLAALVLLPPDAPALAFDHATILARAREKVARGQVSGAEA